MSHTNKLESKYVADIERLNSNLENTNFSLQKENEKLLHKNTQLQGANEDLSKCLALISDVYSNDAYLLKLITKTLNEVTKKLIKEKYND